MAVANSSRFSVPADPTVTPPAVNNSTLIVQPLPLNQGRIIAVSAWPGGASVRDLAIPTARRGMLDVIRVEPAAGGDDG